MITFLLLPAHSFSNLLKVIDIYIPRAVGVEELEDLEVKVRILIIGELFASNQMLIPLFSSGSFMREVVSDLLLQFLQLIPFHLMIRRRS